MRRSRFVSSVQPAETAKLSIWEALWFDLRAPETGDDVALSEWRIGGLDHVAFLLGVMHLLIAATSVFLSTRLSYSNWLDNPLIPSGLVIMLDVMAAAALLTRNRFDLAPHTIVRCLCIYIALVGLAWTWFGHAIADDQYVSPLPAGPIALCAGIAMGTIVSINSPPLAVVNAIVSAIAAMMLANSPLVPIGVEIIALVLVGYSVANASGFIATGRKRLGLEAHARKAQHFVDEFENSGRGWFWETDSLATLSYVSRQLADDFQCEPEELLGRKMSWAYSDEARAGDHICYISDLTKFRRDFPGWRLTKSLDAILGKLVGAV